MKNQITSKATGQISGCKLTVKMYRPSSPTGYRTEKILPPANCLAPLFDAKTTIGLAAIDAMQTAQPNPMR